MILTCPNCSTRYLLPAHVLAPEGRRVKCSKCSEIWKQLPDADEMIENLEQTIEDIPESVRPIPEGSSVPVIREEEPEPEIDPARAKIFGFTAAALVFLLILAGLLLSKDALVRKWPETAAFYRLIGMEIPAPGQGLIFDRIRVTRQPGHALAIEGHILNLTDQAQTVPAIEAVLKDAHGETLETWIMEAPSPVLEAEGSAEFKVMRAKTPNGADSLTLRFVLRAPAPHGG